MNRLTKSRPLTEYEAMNLSLTDLYMRLKAYEDTGLEPEQIRELLHDSTGPLHKKLGEWIDAGQEGRLLVLPCKVGDTVWAFWYLPTSSRYVIYCAEVKEFRLREKHFGRDISVLLEPVDFRGRREEYGEDDFGKTVFMTREDAEKALDGMKKMTWGDRIRAMTDEELADWLKYERISVCPPDTGHIHCNVSDICADRKCWLDWLKQEVTDNG